MNVRWRSFIVLVAILSFTSCRAAPAQEACLPAGADTVSLTRPIRATACCTLKVTRCCNRRTPLSY